MRETIDPSDSDITAMRFAAATKTCGCYNYRNEVVANSSSMQTRDSQAADLSEITAMDRWSRSRACGQARLVFRLTPESSLDV